MKSILPIAIGTFVAGLVLFTNTSCILEPEREFIYSDTTMVDDTVEVHDTTIVYSDTLHYHDTTYVHDTTVVHDTINIHDTTYVHDTTVVHDTINIHDTTRVTIHDTVEVHDTLRTFATNTPSSSLVGTWESIVAGQNVRLSISTDVYPYTSYAFSFTANIGTKAYDGYIKSATGNNATVDINGPSAYGEDANWIFSISNNILTLQQTGYQMFPTSQAFTLGRLN